MTVLEAEKIRMPFGHYRDRLLGEIAADDVLYLDWLAGQNLQDAYLVDAVAVLVEKHSAAIARKIDAGEKPKLFNHAAGDVHQPRPKQLKLEI